MAYRHYPVGGKWSWFGGLTEFQWQDLELDIVGFLAVLGEGAVLATSQVSFLTWVCYVPRVMPAPQALLPPNRPVELPSTRAWVTGVFNGNHKDHLYYVGKICLHSYAIFSCPRREKQSLNGVLEPIG